MLLSKIKPPGDKTWRSLPLIALTGKDLIQKVQENSEKKQVTDTLTEFLQEL